MPTLYLLLIASALSAVLAGGSAWKVQSWRQDSKEKAAIVAAAEVKKFNQAAANSASTGFETDKVKNVIRTRIVKQTIEKIVDRPVYSNVCLDDDGLRTINNQISRTSDDTSKPGVSVSGSHSPN